MNKKHGMRNHRAYNTWNHMMHRCYSVKDKRYKYYGQRGIIVDEKWHFFSGFWDEMGSSYIENMTLDRIDVNGNYTKENCRWVSWTTQSRNKRNTVYVTIEGERKSLRDVCEERKINYNLVYQRIKIYRWQPLKALITPSRIHNGRRK